MKELSAGTLVRIIGQFIVLLWLQMALLSQPAMSMFWNSERAETVSSVDELFNQPLVSEALKKKVAQEPLNNMYELPFVNVWRIEPGDGALMIVAANWKAYIIIGFFLVFGLLSGLKGYQFLNSVIRKYRAEEEMVGSILLSLVLFGIAIGFFANSWQMIRYYSTPLVRFDKSAGEFSLHGVKGDIKKIKALQIISTELTNRNKAFRQIRTERGKPVPISNLERSESQLNIVYADGQRDNITNYNGEDDAFTDASRLSSYLGVPYWSIRRPYDVERVLGLKK